MSFPYLSGSGTIKFFLIVGKPVSHHLDCQIQVKSWFPCQEYNNKDVVAWWSITCIFPAKGGAKFIPTLNPFISILIKFLQRHFCELGVSAKCQHAAFLIDYLVTLPDEKCKVKGR